jgi:AcrR family transcriptional regulator
MPTRPNSTASKSPREASSLWKPMRRRRDRQFEEKKEAVLSTAAGLFRARGYAEVSLNDVADVLNITKPTLYYYVGSKDQFLYEIVTRGQEKILSAMQAIDRSPGTGAEKLRDLMLRYIGVIASDYGACMLLLRPRDLKAKFRTQIDARVKAANELIYRIFACGEKDGTLDIADRTVTLRVLFGSLNWIGRWYDPAGRIGPEEHANMHVDILLNGVVTERDQRSESRAGRRRGSQSS